MTFRQHVRAFHRDGGKDPRHTAVISAVQLCVVALYWLGPHTRNEHIGIALYALCMALILGYSLALTELYYRRVRELRNRPRRR